MEKEKYIVDQLNILDVKVSRAKKKTSQIIKDIVFDLIIVYGCLFGLGAYVTACTIGGLSALQNGLFDILLVPTVPGILRNAILGILFAAVVFVFIMLLWLNWIAISNFFRSLGKTWVYQAQFKNIITNEYDAKQPIFFDERKSVSPEKLSLILVQKINSKYRIEVSMNKIKLPNE